MIGIVLKVSRRMAKGLEGYKREDNHKLLTTRCTVMFLPVPLSAMPTTVWSSMV